MRKHALDISNLEAWYGEGQALHGVSLHVDAGEIVSLTGRNGAGKTSVLRALMGILSRRQGSVTINGKETIKRSPESVAREGIAFCPDDRGIFGSLNVLENLMLPPIIAKGGMSLDEIYSLFPNLPERLRSSGKKLSGGEQQMLSIARILRTGARLLLFDEPTEGLAPVIVSRIADVCLELKRRGYSLLVTEQNFDFVEEISDRFYVMETGRIIDSFSRDEIAGRRSALEESLGL